MQTHIIRCLVCIKGKTKIKDTLKRILSTVVLFAASTMSMDSIAHAASASISIEVDPFGRVIVSDSGHFRCLPRSISARSRVS
jgi:hypothetical protein